MIGNALGVWPFIFVAAIAFATLAIGIPFAILAILAQVERIASWALERIRCFAVRGTSASNPRPEREIPQPSDELPVR